MRRKSKIENKKEERSTIDTSIKSNQKAYEKKPIAWTCGALITTLKPMGTAQSSYGFEATKSLRSTSLMATAAV